MNLTISSAWSEEIGPVYLTEAHIQARVAELGAQISRDYADKDLVVIGILKGVIFFMADLLRAMTIPVTLDFLAISRYGAAEQTHGVVRLTKDLNEPLEGRHVLFVEDIVDTGLTTHFIMRTLRLQSPQSLAVCVLLNRTRRRLVDIKPEYVGFEVPETYLVGYGLDYKERYRNLPYLAQFEPRPAGKQ